MQRVMIVDDDALIRDNLAAFLEDEGMLVTGVASGEDALSLLRRGESFDVCVMDMRLPGMDGNESIRALRAIVPGMAFVVFTGSAGYSLPGDLRADGIERGHIFHKPLQDMTPLAEAIRALA